MKLAEALILRADYQKRLVQLKARLIRNAKVQEGDTPGENPQELIEEVERVAADLQQLIQRINKTNVATELESAMTLSDALAMRDVLELRTNYLATWLKPLQLHRIVRPNRKFATKARCLSATFSSVRMIWLGSVANST